MNIPSFTGFARYCKSVTWGSRRHLYRSQCYNTWATLAHTGRVDGGNEKEARNGVGV
jgi:hypothetical protein